VSALGEGWGRGVLQSAILMPTIPEKNAAVHRFRADSCPFDAFGLQAFAAFFPKLAEGMSVVNRRVHAVRGTIGLLWARK
jgi:hypothetical protein